MTDRLYIDQVLEKHMGKHISVYFYKPDGEDDRIQGYLSDYSQSFIELANKTGIGNDQVFKKLLPMSNIRRISTK